MTSGSDWASVPPDVVGALRRLLHLIQPVPDTLVHPERNGTQDVSDQARREHIASWLYAHWYTDDESQETAAPAPGRGDLASALAVTVASSGQWETGWVAMQSSPSGACVAGRRGVTRQLLPGQFANIARPGIPPRPGDGLAVNKVVDWVDDQTGFWHLQSSLGEPSPPLMRVYWNVDWPHVGYVLEHLTNALEDTDIPYVLKCPVRAAGYRRVDTVVVYLDRGMWDRAEPALTPVAAMLEHRLRRAIPPLTRALGTGVSYAEDPGGSVSFGESRCAALAPAVLALIRDPSTWSEDDGLATLMQSLRDAGIDPRRPWAAANT